MRFLSYNIQYGLGKDRRFDLARIAAEAEAGDVIALQEVERFWQRSGEIDQPAELARHLGAFHWGYGANLDLDADLTDADGRPIQRRRQFGNMILSRSPILSSRNLLLPKYGTLHQHSIQRGALEVVIDTPGHGPLRVYSIHLCHLAPGTRLPQVRAILERLRQAPAEGGAWCGGHPRPGDGWSEGVMPPMPREAVLMGDFNFSPEDEEYPCLVGPPSRGYGRLNNVDGLVDSWVAAGHDEGEGVTCSGQRIDYIFVSATLADRVERAWIDHDARGSDHQPIGIDLKV